MLQTVGEAAPTERSRLEAIVPTRGADNRAVADVARGVAPAVVEEEVAKSDPDVTFADDANVMGLAKMSVLERSGSFVIPGLPIRDVRITGAVEGSDSGVTVVQELPDGRTVELRFLPNPPRGVADERFAEGLLELPVREGWRQVVRPLPEGVAVLRGPLSETELSELLEEALAGR